MAGKPPAYKKSKLHRGQDRDLVNAMFSKKYEITVPVGNLPSPSSLFTVAAWTVPELQDLKVELNTTKSMLNDLDFESWHKHTTERNKAGDVQGLLRRNIAPELPTQAWCKFYEIVDSYDLTPAMDFASVHLCEAPGAFVTSLNHWLRLNNPGVRWEWLAMTLNPYYEGNSPSRMISDDRFIVHTLDHWFFGPNFTGDIFDPANLDAIVKRAPKNVFLVTADGSVNCMDDPGEQENVVVHLHFCECLTALHLLETGGNFLLKVFTIFEHRSVCLVYFLTSLFAKVFAFKPATSKEGNSEVYLVFKGFKGRSFVEPYFPKLREHYKRQFSEAMFAREDIPGDFMEKMIGCGAFFKGLQCEVILGNLRTFESGGFDPEVKRLKKIAAREFLERYGLTRIKAEEGVLGGRKMDLRRCIYWSWVKVCSESFSALLEMRSMGLDERLLDLAKRVGEDEDFDGRRFSLTLTNESNEMTITKAKPYEQILSSKFCTSVVTKIKNTLDDIVEKMNLQIALPTEVNVESYEKNLQNLSSCEILHFKYNDNENAFNTTEIIYNALKKLHEGHDLILIGFGLMTQFHVGILKLLILSFESNEIHLEKEIGCAIFFRNRRSGTSMKKFGEILHAVNEAKIENKIVLSIFPVTNLLDEEFYPTIIKINCWVVKTWVRQVAKHRNLF